jgi:hypothetical protein
VPDKTPVGFETEINAFLRQDSASFPPAGAVLFTGSSTIRMWKNLATDFPGMTPAEFIRSCESFIRKVRTALPKTRICFLSIKPSFARKKLIPVQDTANAMLKTMADKNRRTRYIDIRPLMYGSDGHLRRDYFESDSLHINAGCYQAWSEVIRGRIR